MHIKYLKIRNFLSVGDIPIEIDFTKLGRIVNIKGINYDTGGSNASGKTSILSAIPYAFYGKILKGLNHKEIINIKNKKKLEVEIHFDDYKIIRRRKPDALELWYNDE